MGTLAKNWNDLPAGRSFERTRQEPVRYRMSTRRVVVRFVRIRWSVCQLELVAHNLVTVRPIATPWAIGSEPGASVGKGAGPATPVTPATPLTPAP
ncbi:MAG: hypothetical protein WKF58_04340 [Ilumatobacteraceae bacterium]